MSSWSVAIGSAVVECQDLTDTWHQSIARHRVTGRNGAQLEHMGSDEGVFRLSTVFIGPTALGCYKSLVEQLRAATTVSVRHPVHGRFDALVEDIAATYGPDEGVDTARVEFTIVQNVPEWGPTWAPVARDVALSSCQDAIDAVTTDLGSAFAPSDPPEVDLSSESWLSDVYALRLGNTINSYVSKVAMALGRIDALRAAIDSPLTAAFGALSFAESLPGQIVEKLTALIDVVSGRSLHSSDPVLAVASLMDDLDELAEQFDNTPLSGAMRVMAAMTGARMAAETISNDEDRLAAQVAREESIAFDIRGNWIGSPVTADTFPATPDQVGRMVSAVRARMDNARFLVSDPSSIETLASSLQQQYRDRLAKFEKLIEIVVPQPTPLHLVCLQHGLPYNCAERIVRLNGIRNPTFTQGAIRIYAR